MKKQEKKNFYITTPIYYASGDIHIGHTYCCVCADTIARFKRLKGYNVRFMTGSDEHGQKIEANAKSKGMNPKAYVDEIANNFKKVWKDMNVSYDYYVRTTDDNHQEIVKKVFTKLLAQGDIYLGEYKGWYCTHCESFWSENQLEIKDGKKCCPDCHREVHIDSEEAYFLNVKKYVPWLLDFYKTHSEFMSQDKMNEMINTFIKPGLEDLCITRTSFDWGIHVKENPKHVIYVWIDALLNYISALGYLQDDDKLMKTFWGDNSNIIHLVGRDITRFHTIYWPILLKALNLRQPDQVIVHGLLLTKSGVKLSKSLGNALSPYPLIERYSVDSLRYYMINEMEFGQDGNFTPTQFVDRLNSDLANSYGNLINRTLSMINKYFNGVIPKYKVPKNEYTKSLYKELDCKLNQYDEEMENLNITSGSHTAMSIVNLCHKYFDDMAPWSLAKNEKIDDLNECLYTACEVCRISSILLSPIMPDKTTIALDQENVPQESRTYASLNKYGSLSNIKINTPSQLFPRLDKQKEIEYLTNLIDGKK